MGFQTLDQADLQGKRALVRVDYNVPMEDGKVTDDHPSARGAVPTIEKLRKAGGAKVILLTHFDRPKGKPVPSMSLKPIVEPLSKVLGYPVAFAPDCIGPKAREAVNAMQPGDVLLLENVRFHPGEEANDRKFADALAANGDLYVNDAFSAAHRAHASTEALAHRLPAYAGEQMRLELDALDRALGNPERPVLGIVERLEGLHQARPAALPGHQAGQARHRRRHGQHLPLRARAGTSPPPIARKGKGAGPEETAREVIRLAGQNNCKLFLPPSTW